MKQILVLGGGAAGMAAAITAAQAAGREAKITLVEANPKLGKKLLATGNGRCNLANGDIRPDWYFTGDPPRMQAMLAAIQAGGDPVQWFQTHGLVCRAPDEAGRIYPYSNQAADVWGLLGYWLAQSGVEVLCDSKVQDLWMQGSTYTVQLEDGRRLNGQAVICALGGKAGPQFGTDGFGSRLAALLGLRTLPEYPCLVPLACEKKQVAGLGGIRVKGDVSLYADKTLLRKESGEVQFTDYGLSGIAVMQLSGLFHPAEKRVLSIGVDVFPEWETPTLTELLARRAAQLPGASMADFMTGLLHRKVGLAVWHRCDLGPDSRLASSLRREEWQQFACALKDWRFTDLTPTSWKNAQTTGGGVALDQLIPESFAVKTCPTLYITGETVDCAGNCGGFNLYWAFGSGILAGRDAVRRLCGSPDKPHGARPDARRKPRQRKK